MAAISKCAFGPLFPDITSIAPWNDFMIEKKPRKTLPAVNSDGSA